MLRIVIDTNLIIAALRSRRGASFKLLSLIDAGLFRVNLSVPLFLEYEAVAKREQHRFTLDDQDIEDILNYIAAVSDKREIFFLWRPYLKDPKDDLVLEVAVESASQFIITHNLRDFAGIEKFNLQAITPQQLLKQLGENR
ncbi:MAG: putative toxin-antitoxin system toxin component, PIN family [Gammaproteobacteria bacterium HGW-Gammaproteobacteria-10]|nr:MAG: putative toxin-antitoxin system toxin component, PIN family [Gammaproteobacteria bacterium HGW-Gammaproteobacteria-10]